MNYRSLDNLKALERTENSVTLEFSVPENSPYFDGHFPDFTLLPAVAQMELLIRFASEYLGTSIDVTEMRRIKFTKFIRPNTHLLLRLEKKEQSIMFRILSRQGESVYSSGIFTASAAEGKDK